MGWGVQTDAADGSKMQSQLTRKHWGWEDLIRPSLDGDTSHWSKSKQASRPPAYYKGGAATRIDDIFVSTPLVRVKFAGEYLETVEERRLSGSDHRAGILHLDMESFLGVELGTPELPTITLKSGSVR